jgi:hypothetical protein
MTETALSARERIKALLRETPTGLTVDQMVAKLFPSETNPEHIEAALLAIRPRVSEMKRAGILRETGATVKAEGKRRGSKVLVLV